MGNSSCDCIFPPTIARLKEYSFFIVYYIVIPTYFFLGTFGQTVLLLAFKKQSQTEKAYIYQAFSAVSKLLENITYTMSIASRKWWSGLECHGVEWFERNYTLMWYTAHLASPGVNMFISSSLFFSLAMAADRVFAMSVPFKYKNINHRIYHNTVAVICFFVGISTSVFDCFRFMLVPTAEGLYVIEVDKAYVARPASAALSNLRNFVRIGGIVSLICLNIIMCILYRKRSIKVARMTLPNEQSNESSRKKDKTLLMLTIWQSILTCESLAPLIAYYFLAYADPTFSTCYGTVLLPFVDGAISITDSIDFFVVLAINKKLRHLILGVFNCSGASSVTVVSTQK